MDEKLDVRQESIKILEENLGSTVYDVGQSNFFHDISPKARETKDKINLWDFIKIKSFYTGKEAINKTKWQPMEWGKKIFVNDISDKGLVSKIHKELTKCNTHKTNNPIKNSVEDMSRHFSKEDIQRPADT